jgi:hypothetical protein
VKLGVPTMPVGEVGRIHSINTKNSLIFFYSPLFAFKWVKNRSGSSIGTA